MSLRGESEPESRRPGHSRAAGMAVPMRACRTSRPTRSASGSSSWTPASAAMPMSTRSSPARSWRCSPTTSGRGPRGSSGRASAVGSPGAGPRCGRSWGNLLGEPAGSLRFRAAAVGKPELDRGPGVVAPSASTSRIRPTSRSSPCAGAARSGWTSSTCARSPRPSGSSRRSSPRPNRTRSPRSPRPDRGSGVPAGLDPQGGRAQGIRRGDLGPVGSA